MTTTAMRGGHSLRPTMGRRVNEKLRRQQMATREKTLKRAIV